MTRIGLSEMTYNSLSSWNFDDSLSSWHFDDFIINSWHTWTTHLTTRIGLSGMTYNSLSSWNFDDSLSLWHSDDFIINPWHTWTTHLMTRIGLSGMTYNSLSSWHFEDSISSCHTWSTHLTTFELDWVGWLIIHWVRDISMTRLVRVTHGQLIWRPLNWIELDNLWFLEFVIFWWLIEFVTHMDNSFEDLSWMEWLVIHWVRDILMTHWVRDTYGQLIRRLEMDGMTCNSLSSWHFDDSLSSWYTWTTHLTTCAGWLVIHWVRDILVIQ